MSRSSRAAHRLTALLLAAAVCLAAGCRRSEGYVTEARSVFTEGMIFSVQARGGDARAAIDEMLAFMDEADRSFNPKREDSALSRFNAMAAGEEMEADDHLYTLAETAKSVHADTGGAFDVTLGPLSEAWGVDNDGIDRYVYGGETPNSLPTGETLAAAAEKTGMDGYECREEEGKKYLVKRKADLRLDFGGLAKGYCTDVCRDIALRHGVTSAAISISGNIMLIGGYVPEDGGVTGWGVGVNNPRPAADKPQYVCGFRAMGPLGIVTSGDYERSYDFGENAVRVSHIIDGKRKMPYSVEAAAGGYVTRERYVISATIAGESAMLADAYSTAVCVMGAEEGAAFIEKKGYRALIFTSDLKMKSVGEWEMLEGETLYLGDYERI